MTIDLRHLGCFVTAVENLHFLRAAEQLGIAQPALSRTIFNLEKELGVTLFKRTNRSVEITTAGTGFLGGVPPRPQQYGAHHRGHVTVHQGKIGSLRIGYTTMRLADAFLKILKGFQDIQPDIDLQLRHCVTATQLKSLEDRELDIGFVTGAINRTNIETLLVQSEEFVCVVYKGPLSQAARASTSASLPMKTWCMANLPIGNISFPILSRCQEARF